MAWTNNIPDADRKCLAKKKKTLDLQVFSRIVKQWKSYSEFQILSWKLTYFDKAHISDGVKTALSTHRLGNNYLHALEQVRGEIRALQTSMILLLAKIVNNVNLITLTILAKRLILDPWLSPGRNSAYWYITVIKIQTKMCKDRRQVKMESF